MGRRQSRTAAERRAQRARAMRRVVSHLASAMLAIETHRGGQLSPLAAALASAVSHGRATVDQGVQVGAPAPVDGTEYFRMSEDGSDVQEQVTEQETPDVWLFQHERVQQCADDERAHTFLAPPERVSERRMDADLGVQVETPYPLGPVQQSLSLLKPFRSLFQRLMSWSVQLVFPLVDVPQIRLLQHELQEEMLSRHGSQFGNEDKDHVELYSQRVTLYRFRGRKWELRGVGIARLLLHRWHRTVRFRLRHVRTNEIDGDIMVGVDQDSCYELKSSSTDDRAWVWSAFDWTSCEVGWETLALEFPTRQLALQFKEVFELVHELNIAPWILAA